jgi:membrane associated rhomboid family serine protease
MQRKKNGTAQSIYLIVFTSVLILLNLNIGKGSDSKVDNWGHLGGLITGIFAGLAITEFQDNSAINKDRTPDRFTEEQYNRRSKCCKQCFCRSIGI